MEEILWNVDLLVEIIVKIGLVGCIYKYLTKG